MYKSSSCVLEDPGKSLSPAAVGLENIQTECFPNPQDEFCIFSVQQKGKSLTEQTVKAAAESLDKTCVCKNMELVFPVATTGDIQCELLPRG